MVNQRGHVLNAALKLVLCSLTIIMCYSASSFLSAKAFKDVNENAWYYENVTNCEKAGIVEGYGDDLFKPEENVSIAETLKIADALFSENKYQLQDALNENYWGHSLVVNAVANNMLGVTESNFVNKLDQSVLNDYIQRTGDCKATRGTAIRILIKSSGIPYVSYTLYENDVQDYNASYDNPLAAYTGTAWCYGILQGNANHELRIRSYLTRAELCAIVERLKTAVEHPVIFKPSRDGIRYFVEEENISSDADRETAYSKLATLETNLTYSDPEILQALNKLGWDIRIASFDKLMSGQHVGANGLCASTKKIYCNAATGMDSCSNSTVQHEIGHAVTYYIYRHRDEAEKIFEAEKDIYGALPCATSTYFQTNSCEYMACFYSSYIRSPELRETFRTELPLTYQYIQNAEDYVKAQAAAISNE